MAEVVVEQKRAPLPPVDPDAPIPEAVKRRAEAVNAFYAQQGQALKPDSEPQPAAQQPAAPAEAQTPQADSGIPAEQRPPAAQLPLPGILPSAPAPAPAPPKEPAPSPTADPNDQTWQHRYLAMEGRYKAAQRTLGEMQEQMTQMGDELLRTQQRPVPRQAPPPPPPPKFLTDQDVQNYGPDLIGFTQRAAAEAVAPHINRLAEENAQLQQRLAREARMRLDQQIEHLVPTYQDIDRDPRWHNWLRLPDLLSGRIRQTLLNDAIAAASAPRVAAFFNQFLIEERATGNREPASSSQPPQAPREPVIPLASLAAPGMARPSGGGDTSLPPDKPFYTRAQISQNYRDKQRGLWAGREADWNRLERDMIQAPLEGRVR